MKRTVLVMMFCALLAVTPALFAQDNDNYNHGEVGAFFDFNRLAHTSTNFYGAGGRLSFNIAPNVQLEAEGAYDWNRNVTSSLTDIGGGTTITTSRLRLVHGLFGPKFNFTHGAFRPFVTVKGGFLNFNVTNSVNGTFSNIANGDTNGVFYPGAGVEGFIGWFGVRVEAGDEMYFDNGANHNFRFTAGPQFRF
ncbi:MAG: hypothetical protein ROO76_22340 [Terriglobia bacterium]|jgi:hypothetical protein|nr:hypothetical protein [Terriglobia bacterium]